MNIKTVLKKRSQVKGLAGEVLKKLRGNPKTLEQLSSRLDRGQQQILKAVQQLQEQGYRIELQPEGEQKRAELVRSIPRGGKLRIARNLIHGKKFRFGVISDTHIGSKYARLDVLNALYDIFRDEGITQVFHAGNLIDGECPFNRYDLLVHGITAQCEYAAKVYPKRKGITTHFLVADDHEGWWTQKEGLDVGAVMSDRFGAAGRKDLHYIGYLEADIRLPAPRGETWIKVMHPGGGTAYALSYQPQKIVESFQGGQKPAVLIIGHYHKMEYCLPREVYALSAGCVQDQTPWMRKKHLEAHVGGWTCDLEQAPDGHVASLSAEWHRFYDKGFYQRERFRRW